MSTRAEISGGAIFLPFASTHASPLSALVIVYGTILMSRCTTSSSKRRPIRRLIANSVLLGLVTAWRLADWPTSTWSSLLNATIDGVVRSPSLFSMTLGVSPSITATQELVVPRSIPITLPMLNYSKKIRYFPKLVVNWGQALVFQALPTVLVPRRRHLPAAAPRQR